MNDLAEVGLVVFGVGVMAVVFGGLVAAFHVWATSGVFW